MNEQEVLVTIKSIYGEDRIYPACKVSTTFASIAGTKTLTDYTIDQMKSLGYVFKVKPQTI